MVGILWLVDHINAMPQALKRGDRIVEALSDPPRKDAVMWKQLQDADGICWEHAVLLYGGSQNDHLMDWMTEIDEIGREITGNRTAQGALAASTSKHLKCKYPGSRWKTLSGA